MPKQLVRVMIFFLGLGMMGPLFAQQNTQTPTQRNYMLVFDMIDYSPKIEEAVQYFFTDVFKPGDQLIIVTPLKTVGFSPQKLAMPREKLLESILTTLKLDISTGTARYRDALNIMLGAVNAILGRAGAGGLDDYRQQRRNLVTWRGTMDEKLLKYAKIFSAVKGENHLLMLMQEELRPVPTATALNRALEGSRQTLFAALDAFTGEVKKPPFDFQKVSIAFRYSRIRFHFLYFTLPTSRMETGIEYIDNLGDTQADLKKLSQATNGVLLSSSKPGDFLNQVRSLIMDGKVETEVVTEEMEK